MFTELQQWIILIIIFLIAFAIIHYYIIWWFLKTAVREGVKEAIAILIKNDIIKTAQTDDDRQEN